MYWTVLTQSELQAWAVKFFKNGIIEPVYVRMYLDGGLAFGDGHHRVAAANALGKSIPIILESSRLSPRVTSRILCLMRAGFIRRDFNPQGWGLDKSGVPPHSIVRQGRDSADAWIMERLDGPTGQPNRKLGQRSVKGKLDEIRKSKASQRPDAYFDVFVTNVLSSWLMPQQTVITDPTAFQFIDIDAIIAQLNALGSTPEDKAIPWLWREWSAWFTNNQSPPYTYLNAITISTHFCQSTLCDWYREVKPNLAPLTLPMALNTAHDWHVAQNSVIQPLAVKYRKNFVEVLRFDEKFWLANYVVAEGEIKHSALRTLGKILGHCYEHPRNAAHYGDEFDLWVLFDDQWQPHWTMATGSDLDRGDYKSIRWIHEIKGAGNMPVRPEHFMYLHTALKPAMHNWSNTTLDYLNAAGLYKYAKPGTIKIRESKRAFSFIGKDGRNYVATWRTDSHEMFNIHRPLGSSEEILSGDYASEIIIGNYPNFKWVLDDGCIDEAYETLNRLLEHL